MNPNSVVVEDFASLCPNRAWPLQVAGQVCTSCGIGLCDNILCNFVRGAEAWAYDTVFVRWALAGGEDPLTVTAGQEYDLFTQSGVGEPLLGGWGQNKNLEYTDLLSGGVPTDRGFMMVVCGAAVRVMLPCQQSGSSGAQNASSAQLYMTWLRPTDDGNITSQRLQILTLDLTSLRLKLGDTGCIYYLGYSSLFSSVGPHAGGHQVTNGNVTIPGSYMPFMVAFCIGSLNDLKRAVIQMFVGQSAEIDGDGSDPTALPPVGDGLGSGTVFVPYQLTLFGYTVVADTSLVAAGLGPREIQGLLQLLAQARAAGQVPALPPG